MNEPFFGKRKPNTLLLQNIESGLAEAQRFFEQGDYLAAFDVYAQLADAYPEQAVATLATAYERYEALPKKDPYNLYQSRIFNFGIRPGDRVLNASAGWRPFPPATDLAEINPAHAGTASQTQGDSQEGMPETARFKDKEFDFVYCDRVLEDAPYPEKICRELMRVAKRGYIEASSSEKIFQPAVHGDHKPRWRVEALGSTLVFTECLPEDFDEFCRQFIRDLVLKPQTQREKALSALCYLRPSYFNTMFLWEGSFNLEVRIRSAPGISAPASGPQTTTARSKTAAFMAKAQELLMANRPAEALALLIEGKAMRQPVMNLDLYRAAAFIQMRRMREGLEALREECRLFPNNTAAQAWMKQLEMHAPSASAAVGAEDPEFREVLSAVRPYTMLSEERLYSLFAHAKEICKRNLPGNFAECGVCAGGSLALLAHVIKRHSRLPRRVFGFDSFEGMPAPGPFDKTRGVPAQATGWGAGTCAAGEQAVQELCARLGARDVVVTVKGLFQKTLPRLKDVAGMLALLHLDGDWYDSTKTILEELYDRVLRNGFLQIDDYGHWEGCRKAVDEFQEKRGVQFALNRIDATGVWLAKPDFFPLNDKLPPELAGEFARDDLAQEGLESQMSANERFQFYYLLRKFMPKTGRGARFLEVGSYAGASLWEAFQALRHEFAEIQAVAVEPQGTKQFYEVLQRLGSAVTHLKTTSSLAAANLRSAPETPLFDFIFLDGDHTYPAIRQDILDYYEFLRPGGLLALHDFLPELDENNRGAIYFQHGGKEPGIRRAALELLEDRQNLKPLELPLLFPADPTQTQAHLPIIPGVFSTLRAYQKPA